MSAPGLWSRRELLVLLGSAPAAVLGGYRFAFGVAMAGVLVAFALATVMLRDRKRTPLFIKVAPPPPLAPQPITRPSVERPGG